MEISDKPVTLVGVALALLGPFLPWVSGIWVGGGVTMFGIQGDGVFTFLFGLVCLAGSYGIKTARTRGFLILVLGFLSLIISGNVFVGLVELMAETPFPRTEIGWGLYLTLIGSVLFIASGFMGLKTSRPKVTGQVTRAK